VGSIGLLASLIVASTLLVENFFAAVVLPPVLEFKIGLVFESHINRGVPFFREKLLITIRDKCIFYILITFIV
jgi:hypothetical protein